MEQTDPAVIAANEKRLWESIVHGLRSQGWSRIEAENEADDRIETYRERILKGSDNGTD